MRKVPLAGAAAALVLGVAGVLSIFRPLAGGCAQRGQVEDALEDSMTRATSVGGCTVSCQVAG